MTSCFFDDVILYSLVVSHFNFEERGSGDFSLYSALCGGECKGTNILNRINNFVLFMYSIDLVHTLPQ